MKDTERIGYIDLAKGFCILFVVHNHSCQAFGLDDNFFNNVIGSFRMPLYFILSGLFFKEYGGFQDFLKRKVNKLIVPFFSFYIMLSFALPSFLDVIDGSFSINKLFRYSYAWLTSSFFNQATWFLLALFFVNVIFYIIVMLSKKLEYHLSKSIYLSVILLSIMAGLIGVYFGMHKINIPLYIDTAFSATPFFCFGYILRKYTNILYPNVNDKYNIIIMLLLSFLFLIPVYSGRICALISNHFYINPLLVYICGISGTMIVLLLSKSIKKLPWVTYIGRYSIMILLTHQVLLKIIRRYYIACFPDRLMGSTICFIAVMLVCTGLIPLFKKYLPKITAQENLIK